MSAQTIHVFICDADDCEHSVQVSAGSRKTAKSKLAKIGEWSFSDDGDWCWEHK